jgi:hypothetical protein
MAHSLIISVIFGRHARFLPLFTGCGTIFPMENPSQELEALRAQVASMVTVSAWIPDGDRETLLTAVAKAPREALMSAYAVFQREPKLLAAFVESCVKSGRLDPSVCLRESANAYRFAENRARAKETSDVMGLMEAITL